VEVLWDNVEVEKIYQHVLNTEGEKHPLYSPEKMEECADYILSELKSYGFETTVHEFRVDGFDYTFRNVEGATKKGDGPELLIVSHYDTVHNAPGANDNGSAIAVMLEAARILAQAELEKNVSFVSFNLEEGNPFYLKQFRDHAKSLGLADERNRYLTWHYSSTIKKWQMLLSKYQHSCTAFDEAISRTIDELTDELSGDEIAFFRGHQKRMSGIDRANWPGRVGLMGSDAWVRRAVDEGREVIGMLCFDTIGYTSKEPDSQKLPQQIQPQMAQIYGTAEDLTVGDFLIIVGDANSNNLADVFSAQSRQESISLPYACLKAPLTYEQAAKEMPDILRSDHAPFWRESIPGLFMSDTANFRYPFYHTRADTIDKLDFDFLAKICKATVATAIALCK
jgi:hypothetical protein